MKKFLFIASALAIVAGCAKVTTVRTADPEEIAVKAVANAAVKAPIENGALPESNDMLVHAIFNGAVYFGGNSGAAFSKEGDTWSGDDPYYWPAAGEVTFDAISAAAGVLSGTNFTFSEGKVTYITAKMAENTVTQDDVVVGRTVTTAKTGSVAMTFDHALAQVVVKMGKQEGAPDITVTKVTLNGTHQQGDMTATPDEAKVVFTWKNTGDPATFTLYEGTGVEMTTSAQEVGNAKLVVPETALSKDHSVTFTYNVNGDDKQQGIEINLSLNVGEGVTSWEAGKKYIYTITFGAQQEILIKPTVEKWDDEIPVNVAQ